MNINNFSDMVASIFRKTIIVLSGLILSLVILETGLRLGGFILTSIQESENLRSIKQKGAYRILCLGESTTRNQYPPYLEKILNERPIGVRFKVIDKGRSNVNTLFILSRAESYLAKYHPDMVVAMMGCNDYGVKYYEDIPESDTWLFKHCRVYRFGRILFMHILKKIKHEGIYGLIRSDPDRKAKPEDTGTVPEESNPLNETSSEKVPPLDLRDAFVGEKFRRAENLRKAIEINPKNDQAYIELGQIYLKEGKFPQTEASFKKAIELNPKNDRAYVGFGEFYRLQDKFPQAEDSYRKAIVLNPENDNAYVGLGQLCLTQIKLSQAEAFFRKAIELDPRNEEACMGLGWLYKDQGKFQQAEDSIKKAIEISPNAYYFLKLAALYRIQGRFSQAQNVLGKAIERIPKNNRGRVLAGIASLYEEGGKTELAREYAEKADQAGLEDQNSVTVNNYRKLKEILDRKGIKLVCVQYPMRNVEPLKKIFEKDEGVIFVDNESVFKEALKKGGYKYEEYFNDMFGGDYGHCTPKGNELLARNIADVILREVFNK